MATKQKSFSFEEAVVKLEEIVRKLEGETVSLEESLRLFEEGVKLTKLCRDQLEEAENKIKTLTKDESGELRVKSESK